ncbi:MAG: polymerase protein [Gemmataceae bacterium]|nr:polymerase protein [Gemmataceae bacterium]
MVAPAQPARPDRLPLGNDEAARRLERAAKRLSERGENVFRVRAYRVAAETVRALPRPAAEILQVGGRRALMELPGIGDRLSLTLEQLLLTGHMPRVEGLGDSPEELIATVPGLGPELARRIHEALHVETLEDLERAANDGRLAGVPGMGAKRLRGIREALAGRFRRAVGGPAAEPPPVEDVLAVDRTYREQAGRGALRTIAPRRFNPTGEAWLPVLKTRKNGRRYRVLFSNTATAHRAGREHDWVVIHFEKDGAAGQCTVVTETAGPLAGRRVIRGRETECARYYGLLPDGNQAESQIGPTG